MIRLPRASVVLVLGAFVSLYACGSDPAPPAPEPPVAPPDDPPQDDLASLVYAPSFEPDYNNLVPQPWVEPVTKLQADTVVVKTDRLEFSKSTTPEVETWGMGRVVVSAPGQGAGRNPFGFARRVVSVSEQGGVITVMTESVSLEDVVTGDFQQVFDPDGAKPVDLSKVDLDWAAANLYQDLDFVTLPGEPLVDDDLVFYDEAGNPIPISDPFLKKAWGAVKKGVSSAGKTVGGATKALLTSAKDVWVAVTPASFTGSVSLNKDLRFEQSAPLFEFNFERAFNQTGKTPVSLFIRGDGGVSTKLLFNPGLQIGARIPNVGHKATFATWMNIDSRMESKIAMNLNLEAGIASAGGAAGSQLEEKLNGDAGFAADVLGQAKDRLLGSPDMKPAGGWKRTLFISKPATQFIQAGPVPVVLTATFQLDLECGFEAKASLKAKMEFEQNATFKFAVHYEDKKTIIKQPPVFQNKKRREVEVLGGGSVTVACGLIPRINAFVYDSVGIFAGVRGSLVGKAGFESTCEPSATSSTPKGAVSLGLYGNVGVQVGARVQAPGSSYAGTAGQKAGFDIGPFEPWNKEFELFSKTWQLDKGLGYCTPGCRNLAQDFLETDADCGGGQCGACATGKKCKKNSDCAVGFCAGGVCGQNHCADGVLDGDETGVDCGGSKCAKCGVGKGCLAPSDCGSGFCNLKADIGIGTCVADHCADNVQNGDETGVDCGGSKCAKCKVGQFCGVDKDCVSGVSDGVYCVADGCRDRRKNGDESGVDCGGDNTCRRCGAGESCGFPGDCASTAEVCDEATKVCSRACHDGVQNGTESDVDCGGLCEARCGLGKKCRDPDEGFGYDCASPLVCAESPDGPRCSPSPQ
jgi:hypothetical protein